MKPLRSFQEFLLSGVVKKQFPDISRSKDLLYEAEKSYQFLKQIIVQLGITDQNSNQLVTQCYDILMQLIRSKMFLQGFKTTGRGAHEAEVSFLRELGFKETEVQFANQLRYFRNGILYYGKHFDKQYTQKVFEFSTKMYDLLKK